MGVQIVTMLYEKAVLTEVEEEFENEKSANWFTQKIRFKNTIFKITQLIPFSKLSNYMYIDYLTFYKCAPINSNSFKRQLKLYIRDMKSEIKKVILTVNNTIS